MYSAVQPKSYMNANEMGGTVPATVQGGDAIIHKHIEEIIEHSFMKTPSEQIYQFQKPGSAVHINLVKLPNGKGTYIIANNACGQIDVI